MMDDESPRRGREQEPTITLARDEFTVRLRELQANPGAVKASSRVDIRDPYENLQTWTIDVYRYALGKEDGGFAEVGFVQRVSNGGYMRELFPEKIMAALTRLHDRLSGQVRKRGARRAVATRIARGDTLGNKKALEKARKARMAKAKGKGEE